MTEPVTFRYLDADPSHPGMSLMPLLPIKLTQGAVNVDATGLLDAGAAVYDYASQRREKGIRNHRTSHRAVRPHKGTADLPKGERR
jgi:hypothetical protein